MTPLRIFSKFSISVIIDSNVWKFPQVIACGNFFLPCFRSKGMNDMVHMAHFSAGQPTKAADDNDAGKKTAN